ncbi:hypothetical protein BSL78_14267 [Apostichopus japonicus]|uniref:Reverse transcriptase domain-containing protein n=1 Tax=Stichopus japonicus TaxID=307972 RepID=A0A2G8KLM3_STIJA|nr:hypothetical protein BSL78_14267 [Apostichopus japonicus]
MDKILSGLDNVFCYIDDILMATENENSHLKALDAVFARLNMHNVRLNGTKCQFMKSKIRYLGHKLTSEDHQPLTKIFGPKHGIPALAAAQRWAVLLSAYQYNIEYRSSAKNANADLLSRLPVGEASSGDPEEYCFLETVLMETPITATEISKHTDKDPVLAKVLEFTLPGWPNDCVDPAIQPYFTRRDELSLEDGCLIWGLRVIIPSKLHELILSELHECHPGMSRMKALSRCYIWWPGLDKDIEDKVRLCTQCIQVQKAPNPQALLLWPWATQPWQRVHIDYCYVTVCFLRA